MKDVSKRNNPGIQGTYGFNKCSYTDLPGLKEIPELGVDIDKEENTCLTDPHKMYEIGIGDLPDIVYKFKYDNTKAESPYRVMRKAADDKKSTGFPGKKRKMVQSLSLPHR